MLTRANGVAAEDEARSFRFPVVAVLWSALLTPAVGSAGVADGDQVMRFDIPRQRADQALIEFAEQADVTFIFPAEEARKVTANAVRGEFTPQEAIEELLKGTGLEPKPKANGEWTVNAERGTADKGDTVKKRGLFAGIIAALAGGTAAGVEPDEAIGTKSTRETLEEVIVTGTLIRGLVNPTASVVVYDRAEIDRSGYATTEAFIQSLPINFKGGSEGASADGVINSANGILNAESASGVNLRGLGTSSTLVLLNGHRLAPSASGAIVDVSVIPLSAIKRIEVLSDGAAALYGSDAVGGVVNIVLQDHYDGAETSVRYIDVAHSDRNELHFDQLLGTAWRNGNLMTTIQYQDADTLRSDERDYTASIPQPTDLYNSLRQYNGLVVARQDVTESLSISADVLYNYREATRNITDPTQSYNQESRSDFISANIEAAWNITDYWRVRANGLFSEVGTSIRQYYFSAPPPGFVNGNLFADQTYALTEATLVADGVLAELPGGQAKLAFGGSYRTEDFDSTAPWVPLERGANRNVAAVFTELYIPLVGDRNALPLVKDLALSASVRYDDYSDFGDTTNPRIGINWAPSDALTFRASYGTSFRAPTASEQIGNAANLLLFNFEFAAPGGGTTPVLVLAGSPSLLPEESENINFGVKFRSSRVPGLSVSLNYFDIVYTNRFVTPPFDTTALLQPDVYGSLIGTFPDDAAVTAYVADLVAQGFTFIDFTGTGLDGIRNSYSIALTNASRVDLNGFDIALNYDVESGSSGFHTGVTATVMNEIDTAFCDGCLAVDLVNTYGQPLQFRLRADGGLTRGVWQFNAALNYANSYDDTTSSPPGRIDSWTTVDFNVRYYPPRMKGLTITAGATNLFDEPPPLTAAGFAYAGLRYDTGNANPLERVLSLQLTKKW